MKDIVALYCNRCDELIYNLNYYDYSTCSCRSLSVENFGRKLSIDEDSDFDIFILDKDLLFSKVGKERDLCLKITKDSNIDFYRKLIIKNDCDHIINKIIEKAEGGDIK